MTDNVGRNKVDLLIYHRYAHRKGQAATEINATSCYTPHFITCKKETSIIVENTIKYKNRLTTQKNIYDPI
jgi:hypothetical protein